LAPDIVELNNIGLSYEGNQGNVQALKKINFSVHEREFLSLVGPSGCGKSTLLRLISGLLKPTEGSIILKGKPVTGVPDDIGFVFQDDLLLPWKTVYDNIILALKLRKFDMRTAHTKVEEWITRIGLRGFEHSYPFQLSGGMRKRVAIAQALVYEPELILMDESFSGLDVQTRNMMENELLTLWDQLEKTIVFVTHDLEEAIAMSDRIVVLSARPGQIKNIYDVDLGRPRNVNEIKLKPEFHTLYQKIWNDLREEVDKAYAENNKA
jgi:NitT/TauT family transport system ATP-binding protein